MLAPTHPCESGVGDAPLVSSAGDQTAPIHNSPSGSPAGHSWSSSQESDAIQRNEAQNNNQPAQKGLPTYPKTPSSASSALPDRDYDAEGTNIYVASLPQTVGDDALFDVFCGFGEVISCKVMFNPTTGLSRGMGFVLFARREDAAKAVQAMNRAVVDGRRIQVRIADKGAKFKPKANILQIQNVLASVTEDEVSEEMRKLGSVRSVVIRKTTASPTTVVVFVVFDTATDAESALRACRTGAVHIRSATTASAPDGSPDRRLSARLVDSVTTTTVSAAVAGQDSRPSVSAPARDNNRPSAQHPPQQPQQQQQQQLMSGQVPYAMSMPGQPQIISTQTSINQVHPNAQFAPYSMGMPGQPSIQMPPMMQVYPPQQPMAPQYFVSGPPGAPQYHFVPQPQPGPTVTVTPTANGAAPAYQLVPAQGQNTASNVCGQGGGNYVLPANTTVMLPPAAPNTQ